MNLPEQAPRLQAECSILSPMQIPPLLSGTILDRFLIVLPMPQVSEQSDQDCQDPHVQSTEIYFEICFS